MLLYTAALAHTRIVTHKQVYTQPSYTQTLLHTNTPPDQPNVQTTISLSHWNPLSREKGCTETPKIAIFTSVFGEPNLISCEADAICKLTPGFDDRTSFRAKGLPCCHLQIAILPQCLTIEPHFVQEGCRRHLQIAVLHQFLTIEPRFVRKGCRQRLQIAI